MYTLFVPPPPSLTTTLALLLGRTCSVPLFYDFVEEKAWDIIRKI
jgi:hypothetical protein